MEEVKEPSPVQTLLTAVQSVIPRWLRGQGGGGDLAGGAEAAEAGGGGGAAGGAMVLKTPSSPARRAPSPGKPRSHGCTVLPTTFFALNAELLDDPTSFSYKDLQVRGSKSLGTADS